MTASLPVDHQLRGELGRDRRPVSATQTGVGLRQGQDAAGVPCYLALGDGLGVSSPQRPPTSLRPRCWRLVSQRALIFAKVDRASRCTVDFARLIRLSDEQDWRLIVTEMGTRSARADQ